MSEKSVETLEEYYITYLDYHMAWARKILSQVTTIHKQKIPEIITIGTIALILKEDINDSSLQNRKRFANPLSD